MKKVLATILALMMLFSATSVFAGDFDELSADVTAKAVADLNALGVMVGDTNGDFRGEATITRAEFAVILCRIKNFEGLAKSYQGYSSFIDMEEHWAKGYVEAARMNEFINGYPDGTFRPQEIVTVGQAAKMLVCALGYEDEYVKNIGFPLGYTFKGADIGLSAGVDDDRGFLSSLANTPATRNFVAFIVSNALDIPIRDFVGYVYGVKEYDILDGTNGKKFETFRTRYFGK